MNTLSQLAQMNLLVERDCRHGRMTFLRTDVYIAQSLGLYGEFSQSEVDLWKRLVAPGSRVVSAGANCGSHIVWWARHVGPKGYVYTAEPQQVLRDLVAVNLKQNGLDNVALLHGALGAQAGYAHIPVPDYTLPTSFGSIGLEPQAPDHAPANVRVMPIDEIVGDARIHMIHLDVEGYEADALEGARKTIARDRPILYCEVDRVDQRDRTVGLMRQMGYEVLIHHAPLYNPANFAGNPHNVFGAMVSINALGIPKD